VFEVLFYSFSTFRPILILVNIVRSNPRKAAATIEAPPIATANDAQKGKGTKKGGKGKVM
jgi:hypothetical protein